MKIFKTAQGRSSIFLAIEAIAKKNKKFILTQAFTCLAVPEAIIKSGYTPLWLDIEMKTYSLDKSKVEESINKYKYEIAALIIQHTYGITPNYYNEIKRIAFKNNIPVIEDRCHCNFIKDYKYLKSNRKIKNLAYCYSFENAKPLKLGRGGLLILINDKKEIYQKVEKKYLKFKSQSPFKSFLYLSIAISYILFINTFLYWPLLEIYRNFAKNGVLPSNFKSNLKDLKLEKMGLSQSLLINVFIFFTDFNLYLQKRGLFFNIFNKISERILEKNKKFPLYVNNKKNALKYCKKNSIFVTDYFKTPIQPLTSSEYILVNYQSNSCLNAEKASSHIIVFKKKLKEFLISKIINL